MLNDFRVESYVGVGPIKFGLTEDQLIKIIGEPNRKLKTYFGDKRLEYFGFGVVFENDNVAEINFLPEAKLSFHGHILFQENNIVDFLKTYDSSPVKVDDWVVFNKIGMTVCNFDKSDQTPVISVYKRNYWDDFIRSK